MNWLHRGLLTLGGVVGLVVVAYLAFPRLAALLIEQQISAYGFVVKELRIGWPGWSGWHLDRIGLEGMGYELEAADLDVAYTWQSLTGGRVTQVTIGRIAVNGDGAGQSSDVEVGTMLLQMPAQIESFWRELPADGLSVQEFAMRSAAFGDAGLLDGELRGELLLAPDLLTIRALANDLQLFLRVQREGDLTLEVMQAESFARLRAQRDVTGFAEVDWTFADLAKVSGRAPFAIDQQGWRLGSGLGVSVDVEAGYEIRAHVQVNEIRGGWDEAPGAAARGSVAWYGTFLQGENRASGSGGAELALADSQLLIEIAPGSSVSSAALGTENVTFSGLRAILPEVATVQIALPDVSLSAEAARLDLSAVAVKGFGLTLQHEVALDLTDIRVDEAGAAAAFTASSPDLQLRATGKANAQFAAAAWNLDAQTRQVLSAGLLGRALGKSKLAYDVDAGTIAASVRVRGTGSDTYSSDASVTLDGLAAHYDEVTAKGIGGLLAVRFSEQGWHAKSSRVAVASVDVGFPVIDLAAEVDMNADTLDLVNLRGSSLGGALEVAALRYDLATQESQFALRATGVQLAQVLALEGDTLAGEAILDGQLPVRVLGSEVSVTAGRFSARPPGGVLRYAGATQAARSLDQAGVGFAIAALADFQAIR